MQINGKIAVKINFFVKFLENIYESVKLLENLFSEGICEGAKLHPSTSPPLIGR